MIEILMFWGAVMICSLGAYMVGHTIGFRSGLREVEKEMNDVRQAAEEFYARAKKVDSAD